MIKLHTTQRQTLRTQLGQRITAARESQGITLEQLAQMVGTTPGNLTRLEQGRYDYSTDMLAAIAQALHHHIDIVPNG